MKLTDIYKAIKEEMSEEDILATLKKQLNPAIVDNPMMEEEEDCLYCGS
jgi:hypothetical protein